MKKIIDIIGITFLLLLVFVGGYELPSIIPNNPPTVQELKPLPHGSISYIKDGILYTTTTAFPINCITKITTDGNTSVIIEYQLSKYHAGMLIISMIEYKRLFGG